MDSDLLRVLCALATLVVPLGVAWLLAGRPAKRPRSPRPAPEEGERRWHFRADL